MNKFNKKGFTLIEMLVVIAIIAVLVSIVIPVVGNATDKAKAATDAANLRAVQAELNIAYLTGTPTGEKGEIATANAKIETKGTGTPKATPTDACPKSAYDGTTKMTFSYSTTAGWTAEYNGKGVDDFAKDAK